MGLPPVLGVFTSILTAPIIALLGRNPVLIGGTASATVPFLALAVRSQGIGGAAKVCMVASVIMMAFCVVRLGRHIARVPQAVVSGFSCGIGGMMLVSQLDVILGVATPIARPAGSTFSQLGSLVGRLPAVHIVPLTLGLTVILTATAAARLSPHAPAPLLGVALAVGLGRLLGVHEIEIGNLPATLPAFAGFRGVRRTSSPCWPSAFGLAFVSSVNILITSRVVEHFRGRHKRMKMSDADAELGAYGIANLAGAIFGAPLSVGIPARSLAVVRCGGSTRLANLLHAAFLLTFLWLGAGLVSHIPLAALAGVTAWMGLCLLDWSAWRRLPKMNRIDAAAFLATAVSVLALNAVLAVAIGCARLSFPPRSGCFGRPSTTFDRRILMKVRLLVLATIVTINVFAQSYYGGLAGTVHDQNGGSLAGAKVTLVNEGTNATRSSVSASAGEFVFGELIPGTYGLTVEAAGFKKFEQRASLWGRSSRSRWMPNCNWAGDGEHRGLRCGRAGGGVQRVARPGDRQPEADGVAESRPQSVHAVEAGAERGAGGQSCLQPHGGPERIFADLHRRRSGPRQQLLDRRRSDYRFQQSRHHHSVARSGWRR